MMEMTEMFAKIRRYGAAWLCACTILAPAWLPGTAVYASETEFHLDLDYILSYEQQQCSDMIFFGDSRVSEQFSPSASFFKVHCRAAFQVPILRRTM